MRNLNVINETSYLSVPNARNTGQSYASSIGNMRRVYG